MYIFGYYWYLYSYLSSALSKNRPKSIEQSKSGRTFRASLSHALPTSPAAEMQMSGQKIVVSCWAKASPTHTQRIQYVGADFNWERSKLTSCKTAGSAIHSSHLGFPVAEKVSFRFVSQKAKERNSIAQKHNKAHGQEQQQITCKHLRKRAEQRKEILKKIVGWHQATKPKHKSKDKRQPDVGGSRSLPTHLRRCPAAIAKRVRQRIKMKNCRCGSWASVQEEAEAEEVAGVCLNKVQIWQGADKWATHLAWQVLDMIEHGTAAAALANMLVSNKWPRHDHSPPKHNPNYLSSIENWNSQQNEDQKKRKRRKNKFPFFFVSLENFFLLVVHKSLMAW